MARLPTIVAAKILGVAVVIASWGCIGLVRLLLCLTILEVSRRSVLRRSHPPMPRMLWTFLHKAELLVGPVTSNETSLSLVVPVGLLHGIFLRDGLVH